jgi:hypothetical protein
MRYIPDFYLPDTNNGTYVEIKGIWMNEADIKVNLFAKNYTLKVMGWEELYQECNLPFKSRSSFELRARNLKITIQDYLAQKLYLYSVY